MIAFIAALVGAFVSCFSAAFHLLDESLGAGTRDGAQHLGQIVMVHAGAVVGDGQRFGFVVDGNRNPEIGVALGQLRLGQRRVPEPVAGVGRVGNQFAQEDFLLAVKRTGDDIQELADFRLEGEFLFCHGVFSEA